ncbi:uncharacterized protein LOC121379148 isoform X2 [Gigantopelta aegis]|nr:uncharacterized protein LOC121379148 isoform X2 [Gigantopelta aegis]
MQTVITWRRPMDASLYPPTGNTCAYLLGNAMCYIISGLMLLVVGVIITSLTFQNLEEHDDNKERYAGPVLIGAGILVIARGAFSRLRRPARSDLARRRSFLRRYIREIYSRPMLAFRNSSSLSLCDIHVTDFQDCPRTRLYSDDPPSYDIVTSDEYLSQYVTSSTIQTDDDRTELIEADELEPPPSYDEFMRSQQMRTTQL